MTQHSASKVHVLPEPANVALRVAFKSRCCPWSHREGAMCGQRLAGGRGRKLSTSPGHAGATVTRPALASIRWVTSQMAATARAGPDLSRELHLDLTFSESWISSWS